MTRRSWSTALIAIVAFAGLGIAIPTHAATVCNRLVKTTGNDGASGTPSAPWRTIQHAADHAIAGETTCVAAGTYKQRVVFTRGGTASSRVSFQNVAGDRPIIEGAGVSIPNNDGLVQVEGGTNYLNLIGFTIQNSSERGIYQDGAHNTFAANVIQRSQNAAIINTNWSAAANDNTFYGNVLHDNVRAQQCWTPTSNCTQTGEWESAINFYNGGPGAVGGNRYTYNTIDNNHGEGTIINDGETFTNNVVHDNWSVDIYIGSHNANVSRNLVYESETQDPSGNNESYRLIPIGVLYAVEGGSTTMHDNRLTNNMIVNTRIGIRFWKNGHSEVAPTNERIDNNTVVNGWDTGIDMESAGASGTVVRDNIIWPKSGRTATSGVYGASGISTAANIRRGFEADPHLAGENTFTHDPNAFRVPSPSSALNAGVNTGASPDYFGTARPQGGAYDVGADER